MRCNALLVRHPRGGLDAPLALSITAFILFLATNTFPFMTLAIEDRFQETTLAGAFWSLYQADQLWLSVVVLITSIVGPALIIVSGIYVLAAVRWNLPLPWVRGVLQTISHVRPWGMLDVFMLGVLVALVKLRDMADVILGPGLYAFAALLVVSAAMASRFEPRELWDKMPRQ